MHLDTETSIQNYQLLVKELLKTNPEEKTIKQLMLSLGLKYSSKSIDRLAEVLAFHPINKRGQSDL